MRLLQDGTVLHPAIHTHRFIKRLESKKNQHQHPQKNSYFHFLSVRKMRGKGVDSLAAMQQEDHSQCLQVVGRTLCNVTFLKGKSFSAQKKETAGEGRHLSLLVCSGYAQIVRHFESHFWDD